MCREACRGCGCILGVQEGVGKRRYPRSCDPPVPPSPPFPGPSFPVEDPRVQGAGAGLHPIKGRLVSLLAARLSLLHWTDVRSSDRC